jgi:hypothetical protein
MDDESKKYKVRISFSIAYFIFAVGVCVVHSFIFMMAWNHIIKDYLNLSKLDYSQSFIITVIVLVFVSAYYRMEKMGDFIFQKKLRESEKK